MQFLLVQFMYSNGNSAKTNLEDKRESFRVQIRRATIDQMLKKRRVLILESLEISPLQQPQLLTHQQRKTLVRNCSLALSGLPNNQWLEATLLLRRNLSSFQGNFEPLIQSSIVYNLCKLIRPECLQIGWLVEVIQLLLDIISLNKAPGFVVRLLDYDFLKNICQILANGGRLMSMEESRNYLELLGNIANDSVKARNIAISSGAVPIVRQYLDQAVEQVDIEMLMWLVSSFVKSDDEGQTEKLQYNMVSVFMPSIEKFIQSSHSKTLVNVMHSVVFLLTDKSYKISNVYHCNPIRQRLLQLIEFPEEDVRTLSIKAVALLCSSNNKHFVTDFLHADLLGKLYRSITTYEQTPRQKLIFLWICENICKNSDEDLDKLVHHPCIHKLFEFAHSTQQAQVRSYSLTVFRILFEFASYNQVEYLFSVRNNLLEMLVHHLTSSNQQPDVVLKALKCLTALVQMYNSVGTQLACNKVMYELERFCQIEDIVDGLTNHENKLVEKAALALINTIGQYQFSDQ